MAVKPMPEHRPRKRLSAGQRREQLLEVTRDLVGEAGFHAVSIEAVARRAGVSRPIVYEHFGDLHGLLEALSERENARALQQLAAILPATGSESGDPAETLLEAFRGYLETVRADPVTWRLALMPPEGAPAALREQVTASRQAVIAVLADFIAAGGESSFDPPDPALTARVVSAIADEAARLTLTDPQEYPIERLLAHARWMFERIGRS